MVEVIYKSKYDATRMPYYRMTEWMTEQECLDSAWYKFLEDRKISFCIAQSLVDDRYAIWCWGLEKATRPELVNNEKMGKMVHINRWPIPMEVHNAAN